MNTITRFTISLAMLGLAGTAFAEGAGDQTTPGASHGPTTVNPSASGRSGSDAGTAAGTSAMGGAKNGTSAAGMGTTQGSGDMQPRLDKGAPSPHPNATNLSTTPGNSQGM